MAITAIETRLPAELAKHILDAHYEKAGVARDVLDALAKWLQINTDNLREFFQECYLPLMSTIFGLDGAGILFTTTSPRDCEALLSFLTPDGPLFKAMREVDAEHLNQYNMPLNRLPLHTQALLATRQGVQELQQWPQYNLALAPVVRKLQSESSEATAYGLALPPTILTLPLCTAFLSSMAFSLLYAPQASAAASPGGTPHGSPALGASLSQVARRLHSGRRPRSLTPAKPLYLRLVHETLLQLLPQGVPAGPEQPPLQLVRNLGLQCAAVMVEMWLSDRDMPTPRGADGRGGSRGGSSPGAWKESPAGAHGLRVVYTAPRIQHTRAITELVAHIYLQQMTGHDDSAPAAPAPAQAAAWLPEGLQRLAGTVSGYPLMPPIAAGASKTALSSILGEPASPASQTVAAHVYRCLRRAFMLWHVGQHADTLTAVVDLWLAVCFPWQLQLSTARYSPAWLSHVLAHVPFYTVLFSAFMDLMLASATVAVESVTRILSLVSRAFSVEADLLKLLGEVEVAMQCHFAKRAVPAASQFGADLPLLAQALAQQARGLEAAALAGLPANLLTRHTLDGAAMFQFTLPLERGLGRGQDASVVAKVAETIELLTQQLSAVKLQKLQQQLAFVGYSRIASIASPQQVELRYEAGVRGLKFGVDGGRKPRHEVPYNGEILLRPVASNELPCIVPALAKLSVFLNERLRLRDDCAHGQPQAPALRNVHFNRLMAGFRRRGWYVDLRSLCEYQSVVFWLGVELMPVWAVSRFFSAYTVVLMWVVVHFLIFVGVAGWVYYLQ